MLPCPCNNHELSRLRTVFSDQMIFCVRNNDIVLKVYAEVLGPFKSGLVSDPESVALPLLEGPTSVVILLVSTIRRALPLLKDVDVPPRRRPSSAQVAARPLPVVRPLPSARRFRPEF